MLCACVYVYVAVGTCKSEKEEQFDDRMVMLDCVQLNQGLTVKNVRFALN